jgi:tRNA(Ile)-lysidine synthase
VPLTIERVRVDASSPHGIEAAARGVRYAAFAARPESILALAHHLDDQAETVLMQLLRGTGLKGIAAMPELRALRGTGIRLFRPLLEYSRTELMEYAHERGLKWIEDESNASTRFDRNYVRLEVGPRLDERYPGWRDALARFARHAGTAGELLDDLATLDGVPIVRASLPLVEELSAERRQMLRTFLARNTVAVPSEVLLAEMSRQLFEARPDARVRIDRGRGDRAPQGHRTHRTRAGAVDRARRRLGYGASVAPRARRGAGRRPGHIHFDSVHGDGIAAEPARAGHWYFAPRSGGRPSTSAWIARRARSEPAAGREIPTGNASALPFPRGPAGLGAGWVAANTPAGGRGFPRAGG